MPTTTTQIFDDTLNLSDDDALDLAMDLYQIGGVGFDKLSDDEQEQLGALAQHKSIDVAGYAIDIIFLQDDLSIYYKSLVFAVGHDGTDVALSAIVLLENEGYNGSDYQQALSKCFLNRDVVRSSYAAEVIDAKMDKIPYIPVIMEAHIHPDRFDSYIVKIANDILRGMPPQAVTFPALKNILVLPLENQIIDGGDVYSLKDNFSFQAKIFHVPENENGLELSKKFEEAIITLKTDNMSAYDVDSARLAQQAIKVNKMEVSLGGGNIILVATHIKPII